jgi:very-short-patch-repair endonuclease
MGGVDMPSWEDQRDEFLSNNILYLKHMVDSIDRRAKSPIEKIVCLALYWIEISYGKGITHYPQYKIGRYTVDFIVEFDKDWDGENVTKIVIECDGHEFHEKTKEQVSKDKKRDRELQKMGYKVLRYSGSDLYKEGWYTVYADLYSMFDPGEEERFIKIREGG